MDIKTKSYINTDIIYRTDLYKRDKRGLLKQNTTDFLGIFLVLIFILLLFIMWMGAEWLGIKFTKTLFEKYVVGLTDIITAITLCTVYSIVVTIICVKLIIILLEKGEIFEQIKNTPYTLFLKPKYLKFYWKEDKLWFFREEEHSRLLTLGLLEGEKRKLIKKEDYKIEELTYKFGITPKLYYHDGTQDIRLPNIMHITAEELSKIREQTTPLQVKVNLCTDGEIQIYLRRKEDV